MTDLTDQSLVSTEPVVEGTASGFHMIFRQGSPSTAVFATTRSSLAGAWDTPAQISTSPNNLAGIGLAGDGNSNAHAIWYDSAENDVEATHWDGVAPSITSASVPTSAVTGQAVTMSASATDTGTGLAASQPSWNFGDSSGGSGSSVSHTYATAGTFNVIYTVTDNAGNSVSGMATITVTASNSGGGGSGGGTGGTGGGTGGTGGTTTTGTTDTAVTTSSSDSASTGTSTGDGTGGAGSSPLNTKAPSIKGKPRVGKKLTCDKGTWTSDGTITYTFAWQRKSKGKYKTIAKATKARYRLTGKDKGAKVRCIVTATDNDGSTTARSKATRKVKGASA